MIGIDEVGRGAWAGPVCAAAVRLHTPINGLDDSKKLSKLKGEQLAAEINTVSDVGIGWASASEVDAQGLTAAVRVAMQRAIEQISPIPGEQIIIDGNYNFLPEYVGVQTIIKADGSVPCVSAASIVAKVARDSLMTELALEHPHYGFESNVGYGTIKHRSSIKEQGTCKIHRMSYNIHL